MARVLCLLTGWLAGWAMLPVATGPMAHGAAGVLVAATLALAFAALLLRARFLPRMSPAHLGAGRVGVDGRPCSAPRAFAPDTAGRPRPRAPGRTAPPSG